MREEIATIIAKIPGMSPEGIDFRFHQQRMELARPKADEILDYFEVWLSKHTNLRTLMLFQEERRR
jgi:hypothetical protein